jgi:hypothetical protein
MLAGFGGAWRYGIELQVVDHRTSLSGRGGIWEPAQITFRRFPIESASHRRRCRLFTSSQGTYFGRFDLFLRIALSILSCSRSEMYCGLLRSLRAEIAAGSTRTRVLAARLPIVVSVCGVIPRAPFFGLVLHIAAVSCRPGRARGFHRSRYRPRRTRSSQHVHLFTSYALSSCEWLGFQFSFGHISPFSYHVHLISSIGRGPSARL